MSGGRLIFLNRFFWPDQSATAQLLTDLATRLASEGEAEVLVVTSRLDYADSRRSYAAREEKEGVRIRRLWSTRFGRGRLPGRVLDYLTIYASFFLFLLREARPEDRVVLKTDPPLLTVPGMLARALRPFRMVAWCQDLFPEVAMAGMRLPGWGQAALRCLAKVRDGSLRRAEAVVVLGEDMQRYLERRGLPRERLHIIPNWSIQREEGGGPEPLELRRRWGIGEEPFVVGYSGNLGRAHDHRTVLAAAREFSEEAGRVVFLCVGGGHGYERLQREAAEEGLSGLFHFQAYVDRAELHASLRVPEVHWFSLRPALTPYLYPSKFAGILQAGRPVIFVGKASSAIAAMTEAEGIGSAVEEGDGSGFAASVRALLADPAGRREAGRRAYALWERDFRRRDRLQDWSALLKGGEGPCSA
ncbi:MAG: glycosyltransferase [Verrucomicrobia bacterium]|nr:glycosyltransferase [Verrucomicrobiota bacterium]